MGKRKRSPRYGRACKLFRHCRRNNRRQYLGNSFNQPLVVSNIQRLVPFRVGNQTLASFASGSSFRIDDSRDSGDQVALGINSGQIAMPGSSPDPANPAAVLQFRVHVPFESGLVHLTVPGSQVRDGVVSLFDGGPFPYGPRNTPNFAGDGAWIYVGGNPCSGQRISTPAGQRVLAGTDVTFAASGDGAPYQWSRDNAELFESARINGAEAGTLVIRNVGLGDAGGYRIDAICSRSGNASLEVFCRADFNNDGFTDFFDFDAFVECFSAGSCPVTLPARTADFNNDGFADFFDFDDFVGAFESGAC